MTSHSLAPVNAGLPTVTHEGRGRYVNVIAMAVLGSWRVRLMVVIVLGEAYITSCGRRGLGERIEGGELEVAKTTTLI